MIISPRYPRRILRTVSGRTLITYGGRGPRGQTGPAIPIDTAMPAVPSDAKAPSTKLLAAQLAGKLDAISSPDGSKWGFSMTNDGILTWDKIALFALLFCTPAMASTYEGLRVDSVTRETDQEIHHTGIITVPTPTATNQAANALYVQQLTVAAQAAAIYSSDPAGSAASAQQAAEANASADATAKANAAAAASDPAGTAASLISSTALPRVRVLERNGLFLAIQSAITTNLIWQWGYETFWDQYESEAAVATKTGAYYDANNDFYSSLNPGLDDIASGGTATDKAGSSNAYKAFDDNLTTTWQGNYWDGAWLQYDLGAGNERAISGYGITPTATSSIYGWILKGSNDATTFVTLDTKTAINTGWTAGTLRKFSVEAGDKYRYLRLYITSAADTTILKEIEFYSASTNNVTIISTMQETVDVPTGGTLMLILQSVDVVTVNTDIKTYLTRDGGTTWCEVTLTKADGIAPLAGYETWIGDVDLTGGSGAGAMSAGYKIQSFGATPKAFNVKAAAFQVRP